MEQHRSACIVLVDDHGGAAPILRRLLLHEGYTVLVAATAEEAAQLVRDGRCDLLLADIGLPGDCGRELMVQLRERHGLKAIAMSGHTSDADREAAIRCGFDRFLAKPIDFGTLLRHVRELTT